MSIFELERALYHLSLRSPLSAKHKDDPAGALAELRARAESEELSSLRAFPLRLDLTDDEVAIIEHVDAAEMYKRGVHPNVIRNFSATYGVSYVERYEEAGLRD